MSRRVLCLVSLLTLALGAGLAGAAEADGASTAPEAAAEAAFKTDLQALLDEVSKSSDKKFLVAAKVPAQVVAARSDLAKITYPVLLSILRNNGLAAVTVQRVVNIVPVEAARGNPMPLVDSDSADIADDEWVTRVVTLKKAEAAQLVPILRPLLPSAGHLAAMPAINSMLIVDRYGNVKRMTALIEAIDKVPPASLAVAGKD